MQTSYAVAQPKAIKGQPLVAPRKSRPLMLPVLPQILRLTITGGAGTSDVTITVVDDQTSQSYSVVVTGSATEATLLANILAAIRADAKLNSLFSVADGGTAANVIVDFTARHPNRSYTLSSVGGPNGASDPGVVASQQSPGGSGIEFGVLVAKGSADDEFAALSSSTTVAQIAGFLFRSEGNHFHSLENDTPSAVDACLRGKHYSIAEDGEFWVEVSEAVTPASSVYVRVEGSDIGDWGDNPAGGQQLWTYTPTASEASFSIGFDYLGVHYVATTNTDGSATATEICNGLRLGLGTISGLTIGGTSTLTIQTAAGTEMTNVLNTGNGVGAWVETTGEDVDILNVSSICRYTSSAAAGELARVKIQLQP